MWKVYILIAVILSIFAYIGYRFDKSAVEQNLLKQKINNYGNYINGFITYFSLALFIGCSGYVVSYAYVDNESGTISEEVNKLVEVKNYENKNNNEIEIPKEQEQDNNEQQEPKEEEPVKVIDKSIFGDYKPEILELDFVSLLTKNKDTVGWIKVNNTNVNYPVVQTTDNDYYLTHDFENNKASHGWVFMDYRNNSDLRNKNTIIYGHLTNTGKIFGSLKKLLNEDWYTNKDNQIITYATFEKTMYYKIFSIYEIPDENYYITVDFNDVNYKEFLKTLNERSIYNFENEPTEDDYIITLSTCSAKKGYRLVTHAKLIYAN